ncbi:hypothetical protein Tco_1035775 [Tanacetum coccineum]
MLPNTLEYLKNSSRSGVLVGITSTCHYVDVLLGGILSTRSKNDITSFERGYGMIHNDEDGDNDANDGDDDEREIS